MILDGEIVALDDKGRSFFQLLQVFKSSEQRVPLVYYAFDLFFLEGKGLRKEPLYTRGANCLPRSSKERPKISVLLKGCRALEKTCLGRQRVWPQGLVIGTTNAEHYMARHMLAGINARLLLNANVGRGETKLDIAPHVKDAFRIMQKASVKLAN